MSLLPQINNEINSSVKTEVTLPSKTYRLKVDSTALQLQKGNKTTVSGSEIKLTDVKFTQENKTSIKVKGSTKQATRSGKNLYNKRNVSGTLYKEVPINELPAGTYTLSAVATSSDTDRTQCLVLDATNNKNLGYLNRNVRSSFTFTLEKPTKKLNFYASTTYDLSNEDTFKFADIQIEQGSTATEYEQYGVMPSPDYPSEIENIEGRNIWNKSEISKTQTVNMNVGELNVKDVPIPFTFSSYLISNALTDTNVRVSFTDSNNSNIGAVKYGNTVTSTNKRSSITINEIPEGTVKIKFGIRMQDGGHTEKTQLEAGTVATPYVPYNSLEVKVGNKNLWDNTNVAQLSKVSYQNGIYTASDNDNKSVLQYKVQQYTDTSFIHGTQIDKTISGTGIYYFTGTKVANANLVRIGNNGASSEFIVKYSLDDIQVGEQFTIALEVTDTTIGASKFKNVMLLKGAVQNETYAEHQKQIVYFPLAEGQKLMEGSYLADDGIHNVRKQVILGDITSLNSGTVFGVECQFGIYPFPDAKNTSRNYNFVSDRISPANETFGQYKGYRNGKQLLVLTTADDTVENFNSKISGSIVEYELAEPETVPYTAEQQEAYNQLNDYELFDGVNYITMISTIPGTLSLAYYDKNNINLIKTEEDRIVGFVDNLEAVKQSIYHILSIERYAYLIYDDNYGVEFEQYIGKDFDYVNATIENTLQEALLYDLRILDVSVDNIEQIDINKVAINFTVDTIYGNLVMEVSIDV